MAASPPILIVNGSPSVPSRTGALAGLIAAQLQRAGWSTALLNLRELPPSALLAGRAAAPGIREAVAALEAAPGVVLTTPIYKASYSGLLKTFLDLLPQFALEGKTVLPLATGGSLAHVLAIDYALRPVLSALGARHVVAGFFVLDKQIDPGESAAVLDPDLRNKLSPILEAFLDSLRRHAD